MKKTFARMLRLYPKDYRFRFEREILSALNAALAEHRHSGQAVYGWFVLKEFAGLIRGAGAEWMAKLSTDRSVRTLHLPDPRMMHLPWLCRKSRLDLLERLRCLSDTSR